MKACSIFDMEDLSKVADLPRTRKNGAVTERLAPFEAKRFIHVPALWQESMLGHFYYCSPIALMREAMPILVT